MARFALYLTVLVSAIAVFEITEAVYCGNNKTHNAFFGEKRPGDMMLVMDHPKLSKKFLRVVSTDVYYPTRMDPPGNITYIEAYDQYHDGHGGCVTITNGGIGSSHVNLHVKSQRNYGLDFVIRIYGRRRW